jgi:hypothetical protein
VTESERGRLRRHVRASDVVGWECSSTPSMTQVR